MGILTKEVIEDLLKRYINPPENIVRVPCIFFNSSWFYGSEADGYPQIARREKINLQDTGIRGDLIRYFNERALLFLEDMVTSHSRVSRSDEVRQEALSVLRGLLPDDTLLFTSSADLLSNFKK